MIRVLLLATTAILSLTASPVAAQSMSASEAAALRAQVDALKAQVSALETRLNTIEQAPPAPPVPPVAIAVAPPPPPPATTTDWKGAPEIKGPNGFSFKPRGRLQIDAAGVDGPAALNDKGLGFGNEVRRAYLGFDGTLPGGFGYRVEADFADGVQLTDAYLTYAKGPTTITLGQHKNFQSLDEMTSDLFTSNMERASFNSAFGFERRVGLSATYAKDIWVAQIGAFTDNINDLSNDENNSWSLDGRLVASPKIGSTQLHLGGSIHRRDFNDGQSTARYRARPFAHTTDTRLVDTGAFAATGESHWGLEAAAINGRVHAIVEQQWMTARRSGLADPTFNGGYAEIGLLLTHDTRGYKKGAFDRTKVKNPVGKGGMGAVEVNARYDWLNLNSAGLLGGQQQTYSASIVWNPIDYVRFIANYAHVSVDGAKVAAGTDRNYGVDVIGMRAQIDF